MFSGRVDGNNKSEQSSNCLGLGWNRRTYLIAMTIVLLVGLAVLAKSKLVGGIITGAGALGWAAGIAGPIWRSWRDSQMEGEDNSHEDSSVKQISLHVGLQQTPMGKAYRKLDAETGAGYIEVRRGVFLMKTNGIIRRFDSENIHEDVGGRIDFNPDENEAEGAIAAFKERHPELQ